MSDKYLCPDCHVSVIIGVQLTHDPTHKCPRHANKVLPLTLVGAKKKPPTD